MNPKIKMIVSMTVFGTIGLFVRVIPLDSAMIALCRGVIAFAVLFGYLFFTKGLANDNQLPIPYVKLFLSGAAMGINWILLFEAYKYTSIALATLSYYFAPIIVILLSLLLFRERLSKKQLVCFIGATIGMVFIIGVSGGGSNDLLGILFGLGAAVFYATVILLNKSIKNLDGMKRTLYQFGAAIIVLAPYVGLTSGFDVSNLDLLGTISLFVVGVFHTGITYFLYFSSLAMLKGQQAAILSYIDPLLAVLLSVVFLSEPILFSQLVGGGAILLFAFLNEVELGGQHNYKRAGSKLHYVVKSTKNVKKKTDKRKEM